MIDRKQGSIAEDDISHTYVGMTYLNAPKKDVLAMCIQFKENDMFIILF